MPAKLCFAMPGRESLMPGFAKRSFAGKCVPKPELGNEWKVRHQRQDFRGMCELIYIEKSRKPLRPGDIFAYSFQHGEYWYGRVISTSAEPFGAKLNLLYLYHASSNSLLDTPSLRKDNLLVPPVITNRLGWSRGYFKTVEHRPLASSDVYDVHSFYDPIRKRYMDEHGNEMDSKVPPCGGYGVHSYVSIGILVSTILGKARCSE